jgi:hypothetical protein
MHLRRIAIIVLGIMTINGIWRFGYYRIFSGKSMEDIPIGFNIKISDNDILPNVIKSNNKLNNNNNNDDDYSQAYAREVSMCTISPMSSLAYKDRGSLIIDTSVVDKMQFTEMQLQLSQLLKSQSETESQLSQVLQLQSETENQLKQTNILLQTCLHRLAQLEK